MVIGIIVHSERKSIGKKRAATGDISQIPKLSIESVNSSYFWGGVAETEAPHSLLSLQIYAIQVTVHA
jgi:hypothetical protein